MSVGNPSLVHPSRSGSYTVQLAPYLIESICELARAVRDKTHAQTEISGLLFGSSESGFTVVDALKTFNDSGPRSDLARRERLDKAFEVATAEASDDPELTSLKLVGWFSLRGSSGLLTSDVEFHNRHFRGSDDLALVIWREAETQIITEVYSRAGVGSLSSEDYRWSSVRLSAEMRRVSEPIDLAMRVKVSEDSYLRTYQTQDNEKRGDWRKTAASFIPFLPRKRREPSGYASRSDTYAPPPMARQQQQSWDSGTLFRRSEASEPSRIVEPRSVEPSRGMAAQRAARYHPTGEVSGLPMVIGQTAPPRRIMPWISTGLVFVLFCGLTFAVLAIKGLASGNGKLSQIMRVIFPGTDLGVHVDSQGEKLLVSWNRRNPSVASATDATLQIFDGTEHREVRLDPGQVADGSVLYKPVSSDVTFRLEVHGTDQSTALGSIRVLDATNSSASTRGNRTLDLSQQPPPTPVAAAEPVKKPTEVARRPVIYRSGENGRVSVPVPLPVLTKSGEEPSVSVTSQTSSVGIPATTTATPEMAQPAETPAAQNAAKPVATGSPTAVQAFRAGAPPTGQRSVPPPTTGSTINGWDSTAPETVRPTAPPPQDREDATPDAKTTSFIGPKPLLQVMPNTKAFAPGTVSQVTRVEVEVRVDSAGHVVSARSLNDSTKGPLSSAAVSAARQWTFQPATLRGEKVQSDHTIVFEFRPEGQ